MDDFFTPITQPLGFGRAVLPIRFDAERETPELVDALSAKCPAIRQILASLRAALPLAPNSSPGPMGSFFRIPNHYRSISFVVPAAASSSGAISVDGAIVFKGTEPLLPDFPEYLDWMMRAPFRASYLPLGLHYPLEMKLPPAAMWFDESVMEQDISSSIQMQYLRRHGKLARLPVPLVVYQFTPDQVQRYQSIVRAQLSPVTCKRFDAKVAGGLGVEVYYYPTLPVRAADLAISGIRSAFESELNPHTVESTFDAWITLMSELLHLGYMPYVPWNHGMGACVDPGNACVDGGFNDLLTMVPIDGIPGENLFWRSLHASIQMLANSISTVCAATANSRPAPQSEPIGVAVAFVTERLRAHALSSPYRSNSVDPRLTRFFEVPGVQDLLRCLRETDREALAQTQFASQRSGALTTSEPSRLPAVHAQAVSA